MSTFRALFICAALLLSAFAAPAGTAAALQAAKVMSGHGAAASLQGENSVLLDFPNGTYYWYFSSQGHYADAYNLTVSGAAFFGMGVVNQSYGGVPFVVAIDGIWNSNSTTYTGPYWMLWVWNLSLNEWALSNVGASEINMTGNASVAWSYSLVNASTGVPYAPPQQTPVDQFPVPSSRGYSDGSGFDPFLVNTQVGRPVDRLSWMAPANSGAIDVQPVDSNGLVYVVTDGNGGASSVIAFNDYGMEVWNRTIGSLGFELAAPLAADNMLIVPSTDGSIYAFNAANGSTVYVIHHVSSAAYGLSGSPVEGPAGYFIENCSGGLDYFSFNGTLFWSVPLAFGSYYASPAYSAGTVYALSSASNKTLISAVDVSSGTLKWSAQLTGTFFGMPVVEGGVLYFITVISAVSGGGYSDVSVQAFNHTAGTLWTYSAGPSPAAPSSPALGHGCLVFASGNLLTELNSTSGSLVWTSKDNNQFSSPSPFIAGNYILSSTNANKSRLYVTSLSGMQVWNYTVGQPNDYSLSSPVFNGTAVFWGDDAGYLYAFQSVDIVNFTYSQSGGLVNLTGIINSHLSGAVNYSWSINGVREYGQNASFLFQKNGTYAVVLSVTYSQGTVAVVKGSVQVNSVASIGNQGHKAPPAGILPVVAYTAAGITAAAAATVMLLRRRRKV